VPPLAVVIVNALQYVAVTSSFLVPPLIIAREAHLPASSADAMLGWAMLVLAVGTTLQALPFGPIGSGYLTPSVMTAVFLGPSVAAVRIGGIALMSGSAQRRATAGDLGDLLGPDEHAPDLRGLISAAHPTSDAPVGLPERLLPGSAAVRSPSANRMIG
jgi:hypothetical protein